MKNNKLEDLSSKDISFLIIVPTLNSYIELQTLYISLKTQTYKNWRTIFVDGDSSIEHKKWIDSCCKDNRFKSINENENAKGIYQSMSQGTKLMKENEWVIFLGSDDWFNSPFALEFMAKKIFSFSNKKEINLLIYGTQFRHKISHKILRKNKLATSFMKKINISYLLFFGYMPMHHSVCFSTKVLKKYMPYNYKYKLAADCELFFRLLRSDDQKIGFMNDILINIQAGGISSKNTFLRLKEVLLIYYKNYSLLFFIPFLARYVSKIFIRIFN